MNARRKKVLTAFLLGLLLLCRLHVSLPVAGPVPALLFILLAELAGLAVIACGIARSLGWRAATG